MSFAAETPLDDVLKYIKQATTSADLQWNPDLRVSVRPARSREEPQLDHPDPSRRRPLAAGRCSWCSPSSVLSYFVEDGILVITSTDSAVQGHLSLPRWSGPPRFLKGSRKRPSEEN